MIFPDLSPSHALFRYGIQVSFKVFASKWSTCTDDLWIGENGLELWELWHTCSDAAFVCTLKALHADCLST